MKRILIIAPHPDDEWIGCGCTLLKALDNNEKVRVLLIAVEEYSEGRLEISKRLAKKYGYELVVLGEKEFSISMTKLSAFLRKYVLDGVLYVPDEDSHADHRCITREAQKLPNKKVQYCVYNNSKSQLRRLWLRSC